MAKSAKTKDKKDIEYDTASPDELFLDTQNPRLAEYSIGSNPTQFDIIKALWQKMAVDELAMSIATNGFFEHEPLFVAEEHGKKVVIEGNRRLAAVKILLSEDYRRRLRITDLPVISDELREDLQSLPIAKTNRKSIWQYIGFKHVNGPAMWGSYAKAQYIAEVRELYKVPLEKIAEQIGDRNRTVQRLYRAMMVIRQAEEAKVFNRENRYKGSFAFSHLYTGLDYDGFKRFLKLKEESAEAKEPVPPGRVNALGELCKWLYGDKRTELKPLIESQNPDLSILDEVLMKDEGITALRSGLPLSLAHDISLGDERIFRESLQEAKLALQRASGTLTTGFKKEETDLLRTGEAIAEMADDIVAQMERKSRPQRRRQRSGGEGDDV
ncbi:MAG: ParB N-terminal domain-containing protein [Gemmataceae bacterium]